MPTADNNYKSFADQNDFAVEHEVIDPPNAPDFDDLLKLSHCHNVQVRNLWVASGRNREDAIDIMRECKNVTVSNCILAAGGKYAVTIKGGSDDITLEDITITKGGGSFERVDIDLGNYATTCPDLKTGKVTLRRVFRWDGNPVRVRVGWAEDPVIEGGNIKVLRFQSLALKLYVWFRRKFAR